MALNVRLDASFDNAEGWKGIREKAERLNSTEDYVTNEETRYRERW
jgi:hypothetical protein